VNDDGSLGCLTIYRTDQQGTIKVVSDGERYWLTTEQ